MPLFTRNVHLTAPLRATTRRKIAFGTWDAPGDPTVYGMAEFDVTKAMTYVEKLRAETGQKINITHFFGKAVAKIVQKHPDVNCLLRFGKLYPRSSVDICFLAAVDEYGKDLSAVVIRNMDKKSIAEMQTDMAEQVDAIRNKGDPAFKQMKKSLGGVPALIVRQLIKITGFLMYVLNIWSPLLGTPRDAFGSVMISNIGSLGLDMAFAPLVPYSRVPLLLTMGAVKDKPVVVDGKIAIAPMLQIYATFDHRLIDGVHAAKMVRTLHEYFEHPETVET